MRTLKKTPLAFLYKVRKSDRQTVIGTASWRENMIKINFIKSGTEKWSGEDKN